MNMHLRIHDFWLHHIHSFYVNVRLTFAIANALTASIGTIYLLGKGLSYTEIGVVWSVMLFFSTVLDFPTGNFADLYGRRLAYVIGATSVGVGMFFMGVSSSLWMFLVAAFFVGSGTAQISGSLSSWLVDEQVKADKKDSVSKIFGDGSAAAAIGGVVGGLFVGTFFTGSLEILYFLSAAVFILTGVFVFISIPDNFGQPHGRWISLPKEVLSSFVHSLPLVILSIALVLIFACYTVFVFVWQPLALELGMQKGDLGYLYSIFMAGSAVGAFLMGRTSKRVGEINILMLCFLLSLTGFLTISLSLGIAGHTLGLLQFALGYGGLIPVLYAWMNTFIPGSIRASMSSLVGTIGTGGIIILQVVMGAFVESWGLVMASLCAVLFAFIGICSLLILRLKQNQGKI